MGEPPDIPSFYATLKSKANALGLGRDSGHSRSELPIHRSSPDTDPTIASSASNNTPTTEKDFGNDGTTSQHHNTSGKDGDYNATASSSVPAVNTGADNEKASAMTPEPKPGLQIRMKNGIKRFAHHTKDAICHSWINVLLVFVPIGIASHPAGLAPEIVFSMNAIAIIPLAGLLAHATEAVAARLGDTLGALLNVSFGNAVELILFIILLANNQIRVVQAALLGSILANLLLILGMAFLLGGLRYQEQIYNSTVTQMSACMLSLAVMSLLLPTAFHAAFANYTTAETQTLHVSRGTSVVLLLVYVLYLVFQLKSHAYMYASTPQHIIDEESHPGLLADMLNSSSSSDSSSDSSSSDSDSSAGSHTTAKRIKRAFRHRKRRKSSAAASAEASLPSPLSSPSLETNKTLRGSQTAGTDGNIAIQSNSTSRRGSIFSPPAGGDVADTEDNVHEPQVRDFEAGSSITAPGLKPKKRKSKKHKKHHHHQDHNEVKEELGSPRVINETTPKVAFADVVQGDVAPVTKRPLFVRPALPSLLANNVFSNPPNHPGTSASPAPNPRIAGPQTLRRTASLPDRINRTASRHSTSERPPITPQISDVGGQTQTPEPEEEQEVIMSRTSAVTMLLISTALVAVCADFMSDAIDPMVKKTGVKEAFIGLIILPIVGNAAEHVTAVLVATKNKMDLAIGVAVGSSIQIAIFITPFVVVLGWIMNKDMSLYFNIFETVALFVTAFVVNFLVLDGRSNYLEGSLLIAAYVIIALASFFYPDSCDASQIGGHEANCPA